MAFGKKQSGRGGGRLLSIPAALIAPNPDQPRQDFDREGIRELAASIMRYGLLQPLTVRRRPSGGYELIAGERRLRAAVQAGLTDVPCIVYDVNSAESSILALVENLQRRDLHFLEEARGLLNLMSVYGLSQEEAARRVGLSQSAVANKLRLLRLPESVLLAVRDSGLTERHARALLRLSGEETINGAMRVIIERGLNVAETDKYIDGLLDGEAEPRRSRPVYILKDVRLFLNTVSRGMTMMRDSGINAEMLREDEEGGIRLTIRIPK